MSGHSKWSTIKRQKGVADAKRGQHFTKLANNIIVAIKTGGGISDPESNFKLRLAIDKARSFNMPKDNIERAIDKARGVGGSGDIFETLYEGFTPGGAAVLIEAVTDNKQRTVSEVKNVLEKHGGKMAGQGAVSYQFTRLGEIIVKKDAKTSDDLLTIALDLDIQDMKEEDDVAILYVLPQDLIRVKTELESKGFAVENAELVFKPTTEITPESETKVKIDNIVEKLHDLQDVHNVFTNVA